MLDKKTKNILENGWCTGILIFQEALDFEIGGIRQNRNKYVGFFFQLFPIG